MDMEMIANGKLVFSEFGRTKSLRELTAAGFDVLPVKNEVEISYVGDMDSAKEALTDIAKYVLVGEVVAVHIESMECGRISFEGGKMDISAGRIVFDTEDIFSPEDLKTLRDALAAYKESGGKRKALRLMKMAEGEVSILSFVRKETNSFQPESPAVSPG